MKKIVGKNPKGFAGMQRHVSLTQHELFSPCQNELKTQEVVTQIRLCINKLIFSFDSILITVLKRPEFIFLEMSNHLKHKTVT